jgi:hypothetical protein
MERKCETGVQGCNIPISIRTRPNGHSLNEIRQIEQ